LRILPIMAIVGLQAIFYYLVAFVFFLIPSGFIFAELGCRYANNGGVYSWVKAAFGNNAGVCALWMEWINNVIAFPATLAMIVATLSYSGLFSHHLNPDETCMIMILILWGISFYNLLGQKAANLLSSFGTVCGVFLPALILVALAGTWVSMGHVSAFQAHQQAFIPSLSSGSVAILVAVMSAYSGLQVSGFHANQVKKPEVNFPKAIFFSGIILFFITCLGSLAIYVIMFPAKINIENGVAQGLASLLRVFHLSWLTPYFAIGIALGAIASLSAWFVGPAKGVAYAAKEGGLPACLARLNKVNMPIVVMLAQSVIATLICLIFLIMPSAKEAFWVLIILTSQFTVLTYVLVFLAAIRLRARNSNNRSGLYLLRGHKCLNVLSVVGVILCLVAFVFGVLPPARLQFGHAFTYTIMVIGGDAIIIVMPLLWGLVTRMRMNEGFFAPSNNKS